MQAGSQVLKKRSSNQAKMGQTTFHSEPSVVKASLLLLSVSLSQVTI